MTPEANLLRNGAMRKYVLECEMIVKRSLDEVFQFFENPGNLARITPGWLSFEVRSAEPITMRKGAEIEYNIKWLGLPMYWKTLITDYEPPLRFVDEQAKGPYALWRHRHTFEAVPKGVKVGDHVEYALPLGVLGQAAHLIMVRRQLEGIFRYRQQKLKEIFGGQTVETRKPEIRVVHGSTV